MFSFHTQPAFTIIFLISLASICHATVLPQTNGLSLGSLNWPNSNATLGIPDSRFRLSATYWGPKLRSIDILLLAVNAMTNMALRDFNEAMGESGFEMAQHPNAAITVLPNHWQWGGEMDRRFSVWGLFLAVYDISKGENFRCATFQLHWDGREVGTITFSRGVIGRLQLPPSRANDLESKGLISVGNTTTITPFALNSQNGTLGVKTDPIMSIYVEFVNSVIPIRNVFITVLGALSELAAVTHKDSRVLAFIYDEAPCPTLISFTTWTKPSKSRPPYLTHRHVIETLGYIPSFLYEKGKFSEVDITIKLDNINSGLGLLRKMSVGPPMGRGAPNVTNA